jgi:hypothetical protein
MTVSCNYTSRRAEVMFRDFGIEQVGTAVMFEMNRNPSIVTEKPSCLFENVYVVVHNAF